MQDNARAVVHFDLLVRPLFVVDLDVLVRRDEINVVGWVEVVFNILETLGRTFMIVESDARAQHIQNGTSFMCDGALNKRRELLAIAREAAANVSGSQGNRQFRQVDRGNVVYLATL